MACSNWSFCTPRPWRPKAAGPGAVPAALPQGRYFQGDPEKGQGAFIRGGQTLHLKSGQSLGLLKIPPGHNLPVGTTGHLFRCGELESVRVSEKIVTIEPDRRMANPNTVFIAVPEAGEYTVNGRVVASEPAMDERRVVRCILE